jgi:rSAM/selenodomain-associated transferase 2
MSPGLSVVIPTWNEAASLGSLLDDVASLRCAHEVLVVDGGSSDDTVAIAGQRGAHSLVVPRGRGFQLAEGAAAASGSILFFVHADVRLPIETCRALDRMVSESAVGAYAFRLRINASGIAYRVVEAAANLRSRLLRLPYGDQGLLITRELYERVGGFADVELMEDVMMARALRAYGGVRLLREHVLVSARRWERDGVMRRSMRNLLLLARFLSGASPRVLVRAYRPEGEAD